MTDLRTEVARAMRWPADRQSGVHPSMSQRMEMADAAIAVVLEEAAKVAEAVGEQVHGITPEDAGFLDGCNAAARSIRNLGSIRLP